MFNLLVIFALLGLSACNSDNKSASDLYSFPNSKPVAVRVSVDYKLDGDVGPSVALDDHEFLLNAFLFDGSDTQVAIGTSSQSAVLDLPVTLSGTHLEFDAVVLVPATAQSSEDGYALHFSLSEKSSSLWLSSSEETVKNLEALRDGVKPGADPSENPVNMSLATTVAYQMAKDMGALAETSSGKSVYTNLLKLVDTYVVSTELTLDAAKTTDLATFASAVLAGLKFKIATDQDAQAKVAEVFQTTVVIEKASSDGASVEQQFTQILKSYSTEVKSFLGNNDTTVAKVFKQDAIATADIPDPDTYVGVVYAPASLTFTDADTTDTIGGDAVIAPPKVDATIDSYNVYFGTSASAGSRKEFIGSVKKGTSPLQVAVPMGSSLVSGITKLWVFPVVSGKELDLGASCIITNISIPSGLSYDHTPATYTAGSAITANKPSSTGGSIKSYSVSPSLPSGLALNTSTGIITGTPVSVQSATTYTVTGSIGSASTTATISITVRIAAPSGLVYSQPAPTYTAGSTITANQPSSSGGSIASYSVSPALPAGLTLNTTTGIITGRPTASQSVASYVITGTNATGSVNASVAITIQPAAPATVTLSPPAAIKSGESFVLSGTCSGELGSISIDIGNDNAATAGVSTDPLACTCENGTFTCPSETITYPTFTSGTISYKSTITSSWAGSGTHTSGNSTTIVHLALTGVTSIDDGDSFDPAGSCAPNGTTVTLTAPAGFSPTSLSCTCTSNNINACANFSETTAATNTALTLSGSITYSSVTKTATQTLTVVNEPPEVLSSQSGVGNAYQASQLGGLSFTRYGHNSPSGNQVSHDEMMDFIDDPIGHADGLRADGSTAQRAYGYGGTSTPGWEASDSNDKYSDSNGEITPVSGGDFFGDTYRGYFVPPEDGLYKFSNLYTPDNADRFMLAPNECPHKAVAVVSADLAGNMGAVDPVSIWISGNGGSYSGNNNYLHNTAAFFAGGSSNVNYAPGVVYLLASRIYYLEIRYAEGGGGNAFAFGVDFRTLAETSYRGISNLKAINMLPYSGADKYVPREACQGSYNPTLLFSDPEGDPLTYGAYLVANDGSALSGAAADLATIGLAINSATGALTGTLNGSFTDQRIVFTATDATGSNTTVESSPTPMYP